MANSASICVQSVSERLVLNPESDVRVFLALLSCGCRYTHANLIKISYILSAKP